MNDQNSKTTYDTPRLVEYGSVRNLTGGSMGTLDDGTGDMTMAFA